MHSLRVEHRHPCAGRTLAWDLMGQLASPQGKVAIAAENPVALLSAVRKQWLRQTRRLQIERARTLDAVRLLAISRELSYMQNLRFTAKVTEDMLGADVMFGTADDLVQIAPACSVLYVTYDFPKEKLHLMTSWMPKNGIVVIYGKG